MNSLVFGSRPLISLCAGALITLLAPMRAVAHDPGLSSATVTIGAQSVTMQFAFAPADVANLSAGEALPPPATVADWEVGAHKVTPTLAEQAQQSGADVTFLLVFPRGGESIAVFRSNLLEKLARGHRQLLTVRDETGAQAETRLLSAERSTAEIHLPPAGLTTPSKPAAATTTFLGFIQLGIQHILTGYDHLLFLLALLLVCESFASAALIITCFTLAHSVTLALATFNVVTLPSRLVEPLIAASIIYVGLENMFVQRPMRWRGMLAAAFGLIHGLGFASVLRDLGIGVGGSAVAVPLLSFNLGVELGQIAIAALILPLLLRLRREPAFVRHGVPVASVLIAVAGAYWLLGRTIGG